MPSLPSVRLSRSRLRSPHCLSEQLDLIGRQQPSGQRPRIMPCIWRCPRHRHQQPLAADGVEGESHELLECQFFRPAKFVGFAIGIATIDEPGDGLRHIAHEDGREFGLPPPISGRAGAKRLKAANRLKKESSGPKMIEGRMTMAPGKAALARLSPSAFDFA